MRPVALRFLAGVGSRTHEWHEWTGYAYHVRRRLTAVEQQLIGTALDCRGTEEGLRRLQACRASLPEAALRIAAEELGLPLVG